MRLALLARTGAALLVAAAVSAPAVFPALRYMPQAVAPWSLGSWQWRLPSSEPLRLAFPKTESLLAVHYGLAIHEPRGFRMAALGDVLPPNLAGLYDMADARISGRVYDAEPASAASDISWTGREPAAGDAGHSI